MNSISQYPISRVDIADTKVEVNCRLVMPVLFYVEEKYGNNVLLQLINSTKMNLDYLKDRNNWVSFDYMKGLLEKLIEITNNPNASYEAGLYSTKRKSYGSLEFIFAKIANPGYAYKVITYTNAMYLKVTEMKLLNLKRNSCIVSIHYKKDYKQTKINCLNAKGALVSIPTYWNLPLAKVMEIQCAAEGANACVFKVRWKNPPYKKTGFYFLLAGAIISATAYLLHILNNSILTIMQWVPILILPIIFALIQKFFKFKKIVKENEKQKEDQNKTLENNLIEIEKANETLQHKVEERTRELTASNEEIKKNIKDLQDNELELIHTGKMTMVGQLAVDVANKLRTPVDKVQKNLQTATGNTKESDPIYDSLAGAHRGANRCEKVINDLLSFSIIDSDSSLQEIDINKTIEDAINNTLEEISDNQIKIAKELTGNLPNTIADHLQIKQVLMIIINNAYDAISEAIKKDKNRKSEIRINTSLKNHEILVEISDTGIGIPKNVIGKIFDPFFSTKPAGKKKGIGLTIGYNAIKRIGGRIEVESELNKGTKFSIYLPIKNYHIIQ